MSENKTIPKPKRSSNKRLKTGRNLQLDNLEQRRKRRETMGQPNDSVGRKGSYSSNSTGGKTSGRSASAKGKRGSAGTKSRKGNATTKGKEVKQLQEPQKQLNEGKAIDREKINASNFAARMEAHLFNLSIVDKDAFYYYRDKFDNMQELSQEEIDQIINEFEGTVDDLTFEYSARSNGMVANDLLDKILNKFAEKRAEKHLDDNILDIDEAEFENMQDDLSDNLQAVTEDEVPF